MRSLDPDHAFHVFLAGFAVGLSVGVVLMNIVYLLL